jgi:hypothetical protein
MLCSLSDRVALALAQPQPQPQPQPVSNGRQGVFWPPCSTRPSVTARSYLIDLCDLELHWCRCAVGDQKATRAVSFCETQESESARLQNWRAEATYLFYLQQSPKVCCPRLPAIAHLGQARVSSHPSTFEARRLAAVRLRCDSFSPLRVGGFVPRLHARITAASCDLLRLLLGSRPPLES